MSSVQRASPRACVSLRQVPGAAALSILNLAPQRWSQARARQLGGIPLRHRSRPFL